jgi:serine/threonine-protein kinase
MSEPQHSRLPVTEDHLPPTPTPVPDTRNPPSTVDESPASQGAASPPIEGLLHRRYELLDEIAKGGMGAVLRCRDHALHRDLAIKVLLDKHRDRPDIRQRFLEEAQIAGQLQHPGVVPVHELGTLPDGRPFFAMKLVQGRTLADLFRERTDAGHDRPRFLNVFLQVCQTVAFAHSKGVIHRDLKPANVMVGAFGEVQVMDWGLAKELASGRREPAEFVSPREAQASHSPEDGTQAGAVLGTLAYMPPEQARGEIARLDCRCDVFGLGAILCELLTGLPPYTGTYTEVRAHARGGGLTGALERLRRCGADPELLALARACLEPQPEDRPADAGAVAAAVADYLAGVDRRLRQAELDRTAAEARAVEERKRRRVIAVAAGVALGLLLVAGTAAWGVYHQHAMRQQESANQEQALRTEVAAGLSRATELHRQSHWKEMRVALDQTRLRLGTGGPDDLRQQLDTAWANLELVERLEGIRLKKATVVSGDFDTATAHRAYADLFAEIGMAREGDVPAEVARRVAESPIKVQLLTALDDWAASDRERRPWLMDCARRADPGEQRDRLRDPRAWQNRETLKQLAQGVKPAELPPPLIHALGSSLVLARLAGSAVPLLAEAQRAHPSDFWLAFALGIALLETGQNAEATGLFRTALALRPATPTVCNGLGVALQALGRSDDAIAEYRRALALDATFAGAHINLAVVRKHQKRYDEAITELRRAAALEPDSALVHFNLGVVLNDMQRVDEAVGEWRRAIALDPRMAAAYFNLGVTLDNQKQMDEAIVEYRKAVALDPSYPCAHRYLGDAYYGKGQMKPAEEEYRQAITDDPKDARAHYGLGNTLGLRGQLVQAIAEYHQALDLDGELAEAHCNLGHALIQQGRVAEALKELRQGHALGSKRPRWSYPSDEWVKNAERLLALEEKLQGVVKGDVKLASVEEGQSLIRACIQKKNYVAIVHISQAMLKDHPELGRDPSNGVRYNAACAAALAGCGQGKDAESLDDKERVRLRRQALDWFKADLASWAKIAANPDPRARQAARQTLESWQQDADLADVRDDKALARLPEAERAEWRQLWADVAALRKKATAPR